MVNAVTDLSLAVNYSFTESGSALHSEARFQASAEEGTSNEKDERIPSSPRRMSWAGPTAENDEQRSQLLKMAEIWDKLAQERERSACDLNARRLQS